MFDTMLKSKSQSQSENKSKDKSNASNNTKSVPIQTKSLFSPLAAQLKPISENNELIPIPEEKQEQDRLAPKVNNTGIPTPMKSRFEALSGFSFDDVRVHYNSNKPAQLQALAYTQGNQVYVATGQEKHLGHELGHVVQQKQGIVNSKRIINGIHINDSLNLEKQADYISQCAKQVDNSRDLTFDSNADNKYIEGIVQRELNLMQEITKRKIEQVYPNFRFLSTAQQISIFIKYIDENPDAFPYTDITDGRLSTYIYDLADKFNIISARYRDHVDQYYVECASIWEEVYEDVLGQHHRPISAAAEIAISKTKKVKSEKAEQYKTIEGRMGILTAKAQEQMKRHMNFDITYETLIESLSSISSGSDNKCIKTLSDNKDGYIAELKITSTGRYRYLSKKIVDGKYFFNFVKDIH